MPDMPHERQEWCYREWNREGTDYNYWTMERVRDAFNFGHGTVKDFERYMKDNKRYCRFERVER